MRAGNEERGDEAGDEQEAERLGITDAKTKGDLGRKTREGKDAAPAMSVPQLRRE